MNHGSSSERIAAALRDDIRALPSGSALPATRALTLRFGAGPVTVQQAVRTLVREGLVETRPGAGTFVRRPMASPPADYTWQTAALGPLRAEGAFVGSTMQTPPVEVIGLHSGYPADELLPARAVQTALARAARSRSALDRPPASGLPELRAWFADELAHSGTQRAAAEQSTGGAVLTVAAPSAGDVTIMPGGQSALSSVFRALGRPGDAIIMESPGYWGAIAAARQAGLVIVPVPRDGAAVDPVVLAEAFERSRARLFYAMPHFANPTGGSWSPGEADRILAVVRENGAFLIEDDWAHDFALDLPVRPLAARDAGGHVVYVRSLTKSVSPAVRIAAVVARGPARSRIQTDRVVDGLYVSGVLQTAALEVVGAPSWPGHLRRMREQLRLRRDSLVALIDELLPAGTLTAVPQGGLNLWLRLPAGVEAPEFVARAAEAGVLVSPGDEWFPAEPTGGFVRLNYSGPDPSRFGEGVRILAATLDRLVR
ncbi:aminotransferase-like domain-containing protein [Herbiconiux solani]|uniref:aminotransferase-like domain-containing protein n=1 Tax=Herbiconiux solani TaxID=661329 RepID=UPI000825617E|nr:PLP-dependent aminotransferase family protein [Herbiconiux solani]